METRWSQNSEQFRECPLLLGSLLGSQPLRCGMCVIMEMQGLIMGGIQGQHWAHFSKQHKGTRLEFLSTDAAVEVQSNWQAFQMPYSILKWEIWELKTLQQTWFIFKSPWLHNQWLLYVSAEDEETCDYCKSRKPAKPSLQNNTILSKDLKDIPSKISNIKLFLAE